MIYYQVVCLCSVLNSNKIEAHFSMTLGSIFGENERRAIRAIWQVDNCQNIVSGQGGINDFKIIEDLARYRDQVSHLDHIVFKKLKMTVNKDVALQFLTNGGCREAKQLSDYQASKNILDFFVVLQ